MHKSSLNDHHGNTALPEFLEDFKESICVLASDKVVVLSAVWNIALVLELGEVVHVEVDLTLVVIDEKRHHIIYVDQAL